MPTSTTTSWARISACEEIPEDMKELAEKYRAKLHRRMSPSWTTSMMDEVPRGRGAPHRRDQGSASARRPSRTTMVPVACGTSYQQQGRAEAARRHRRLYARPRPISPPSRVPIPRPARKTERHASDDEPFCRAGVQDRDRPLCGQALTSSASTPVPSTPAPASTTPSRTTASAWAVSCRCTPTTVRTSRRSTPAISPRRWA